MLLATTCVSGMCEFLGIRCQAQPDVVLALLELSFSLQRQEQKKKGVKVKSALKTI